MNGAAIGALICTIFGGVWAIAGGTGLPKRSRIAAITFATVFTLLLVAFVFVRPEPAVRAGVFQGRVYGLSVAGEVLAIVIAVALLRWRRRRDLILPAVGLIVGLHFIGMWKAVGSPLFLAVAAAMSAVSLVAFLLPGWDRNGFSARQSVAGFGCAAILWIAALAIR